MGPKGLWLAAQVPIHRGVIPTYNSYLWTDTVDSWSFEGCEGEPTYVDVYTDAAEAEVFVNGRSVGRQAVCDYFAKFPCTYEAGEVVAVGYDEQGHEVYRNSLRSAAPETCLHVRADRSSLAANGEDFCFIDIAVADTEGIVKTWPERQVNIEVSGAGTLAGFGSANHINAEKFNNTHHLTYQGRLQAVIRSGVTGGELRVTLSCDGLDPVTMVIPVEEEKHE